MSEEQRRTTAMGQFSAEDASGGGTTIVGGQPPGSLRRPVDAVPVGMERVLYAAAVDPAFRERLLRDREAAVRERGFNLRPSELAMLRLTPVAQLEAAINGIDTSEPALARRKFLRAVAASVVTLAAADALVGCEDDPQIHLTGIQPGDGGVHDSAQPRADVGSRLGDGGVQDVPQPGWDSAGIQPDDAGVGEAASYGIRPDDLGVGEAATKGIRPG